MKGSAATVALAGLASVAACAPDQADDESVNAEEPGTGTAAAPVDEGETYDSFCRCNCGDSGCAYKLTVREGNVTFVEPKIYADADAETKGRSRICLRGLSNVQREYDPERILYPMRRTGERGAGEWERVSWDEAIAEVVEKWQQIIDEDGPAAFAKWTNFGQFGQLNGAFGSCWSRLAFFTGCSQLTTGADWGFMYPVGFNVSKWHYGDSTSALHRCKNIVIWGEDTSVCYQHTWRYICDAKEAGARIVVVDPRFTRTAAQGDIHLRPHYNSDSALCLGIANYLIENEKYDAEFMKSYSDGAFLVRSDTGAYLRAADVNLTAANTEPDGSPRHDWDYVVWDAAADAAAPASDASDPALTGTYTVEGIECTTAFSLYSARAAEWPLDRTSDVCGLTEDEIKQLADIIAEQPTLIKPGLGMSHSLNCHTAIQAMATLVTLTGNIGKPGTGLSFYSSDERFMAKDYYGYPEASNVVTDETGAVTIEGATENRRGPAYSVLKFPEIMSEGTYGGQPATIRGAIVHSANPLANIPDRQAILGAVQKLDYLVVVDFVMSETARYADIVLPCSFWFEQPEEFKPNRQHYVHYGPAAIDPIGESLSDFDICKLIGTQMGFGEFYDETQEEVLKNMIDGAEAVDVNGEAITFDRLAAEGQIRLAKDDDYDGTDVCATDTGRFNFYVENPAPRLDWGEEMPDEHLPYFAPPAEAWNVGSADFPANELAERYPLIFLSCHSRWRIHTTYSNSPWLKELYPEPVIYVNPDDAEARGIADGDVVRAFNDRGEVVLTAHFDAGLFPGTVNVPHGWQEGDFIKGHYSNLSSRATHQLDASENYYDCLCQIEKYQEA
ncbi:Dimethylsulfide dehydrogenase subunit alpha precursor [Slackia heliotrinireducens]|nr:Dimethylsulfide dehydrogenase subunit alpha precursor [Slackia heliotrinireducens]